MIELDHQLTTSIVHHGGKGLLHQIYGIANYLCMRDNNIMIINFSHKCVSPAAVSVCSIEAKDYTATNLISSMAKNYV